MAQSQKKDLEAHCRWDGPGGSINIEFCRSRASIRVYVSRSCVSMKLRYFPRRSVSHRLSMRLCLLSLTSGLREIAIKKFIQQYWPLPSVLIDCWKEKESHLSKKRKYVSVKSMEEKLNKSLSTLK